MSMNDEFMDEILGGLEPGFPELEVDLADLPPALDRKTIDVDGGATIDNFFEKATEASLSTSSATTTSASVVQSTPKTTATTSGSSSGSVSISAPTMTTSTPTMSMSTSAASPTSASAMTDMLEDVKEAKISKDPRAKNGLAKEVFDEPSFAESSEVIEELDNNESWDSFIGEITGGGSATISAEDLARRIREIEL